MAVLLCAAAGLSVVHDLARAAAVRHRWPPLRAVRVALRAITRPGQPAKLAFAWGWRGLAGLAIVGLGARSWPRGSA